MKPPMNSPIVQFKPENIITSGNKNPQHHQWRSNYIDY